LGGAGGAFVALRKRFTEPPSRYPLYLFGKYLVEIPYCQKGYRFYRSPENRY
jgi:hypothetical protein